MINAHIFYISYKESNHYYNKNQFETNFSSLIFPKLMNNKNYNYSHYFLNDLFYKYYNNLCVQFCIAIIHVQANNILDKCVYVYIFILYGFCIGIFNIFSNMDTHQIYDRLLYNFYIFSNC
jgi:hypothetical protein